MTTSNFTLHIARGQSIPATINPETRIRTFIEECCAEYHLPLTDRQQRPLEYMLWNHSQGRPLSREQSLQQTGCRPDDVLYLGLRDAPWWEEPAEDEEGGVPPPPPGWRPGIAQIGFAVGALVLALVLALPYLLGGDESTDETATPTAPAAAVAEATPTLAEPPTGTPTVAGAQEATPTLLVSSPTPSLSPTAAALRTATVAGVVAGYRTINPDYFFNNGDIFGAYLWAEAELKNKVPAPSGFVLLSNGDTVEILNEALEGLYQIRVVTNQLDKNDPAVVGAEGWITRWLSDNTNVPPTPTPKPVPTTPPSSYRRFSPQVGRSYPSSADSGQRASCVQGRVVDLSGNGVGAATLVANNGAESSTGIIADGSGNFKLCGLGISNWRLALRFVPKTAGSSENALRGDVVQDFFVNGSSSQAVIINFVEVR